MIELEDLAQSYIGSPPIVYFKVREAMEDENASFGDIADILSGDPSLSGRLLKIVNSPFYGLEATVETISHAMSIVGMNELSMMVLATAVQDKFSDIPGDLVDMNSFWKHSIATGVIAREISVFKKEVKTESIYVAGMLHDIGSLVLYAKEPKLATELLMICKETGKPLCDVELESLGFTHGAIGAELFKNWKLPDLLIECTENHHSPKMAKNFPKEAAVIHLADYIAHELELGNNGEPELPPLDPNVYDQAEIMEVELEFVKTPIPQIVDDTLALFTRD